jgi:hypothetical protein
MTNLYKEAGRGPKGAGLVLEAFNKKHFDKADFSIKALAIETMGESWVDQLSRTRGGGIFLESAPIDASAFANLANVVLTGVIIKEFQEADINIGDTFAETRDVPYIQQGRDIEVRRTDAVSTIVKEGRSFPRFGLSENWKMYPDTEKRGAIIELTKEAISEDRTGTLISQARTVADEVVMDKNLRILKVVLGIDNAVYLPQGTAAATYTTTGDPTMPTRKNLLTGNELVDWTSIDAAQLLWSDMRHPITGRPIVPPPEEVDILVMPYKLATANRILRATSVQVGERAANTGVAAGVMVTDTNPITDMVNGKISRTSRASQLSYYLLTLAAASGGGGILAANAKKYWYLGSFKRAFAYLQNYPLQVITRGAGTTEEFDRDVVFAVRAAERGVMGVVEPRYVIQCNG